MRLTTDRTDRFAISSDEFWQQIQRVDQYATWWPWLHAFDGQQMAVGQAWRCTVQPPVPYAVHFTITIDRVEPARLVTANIHGDISGTAQLHIQHDTDGCRARLVAELSPDKRSLRIMSIAAWPVVRFGHDWVLATGVRQFRAGTASHTL